jgi:integrase/recombinase XerD
MKKIKKVDGIGQKELSSAVEEFIRHCRLKNLSPRTIEYYSEDLKYFQKVSPIRYVDEFTPLVMEDFVDHEMTKGNSISAINTRIRGLRVFLNFCADREYIKKITFPLIKEDEHLKEPYTDAELQRLLKKPTGERWGEWRSWAAINTFLATGVRANTLVNIKICEVDFEHDTIFLRKLKNRKQQMIPLSKTLKEVLVLYLKLWDWDSEYFLFPSINNRQLSVHALEDSIRHYNISRNVTKTSLHLFRHTFAKNYILAGGGMVQLQSILGHSTLDMTRRYINLYGRDIHRDFDKLNPLNNIMDNLPED